MPRLLLAKEGVLRKLASVDVLHDGSIVLSLVGSIDAATGARKTADITIHTTGRTNYKFGGLPTMFLPCLLDLAAPISVGALVVRCAEELPEVATSRAEDGSISVPSDADEALVFEFFAAPAVAEMMVNELCRFGVEGLFALIVTGGIQPKTFDMSAIKFFLKSHNLSSQAISEPEAYLRFKKSMYAADVVAALGDQDVPAELVEADVQRGPGLYPPNGEGVWTIVTSVVMRDRPALNVTFDSPKYRAEVVELRPTDTRLAAVRVRFRVIDTRTGDRVKSADVGITGYTLDAEL